MTYRRSIFAERVWAEPGPPLDFWMLPLCAKTFVLLAHALRLLFQQADIGPRSATFGLRLPPRQLGRGPYGGLSSALWYRFRRFGCWRPAAAGLLNGERAKSR